LTERTRTSSVPDFEMILKVSTNDQQIFDELVEYLKLTFSVKPRSERMYNCETQIYFQYLSLKKKG
jgi:hypothetical protein